MKKEYLIYAAGLLVSLLVVFHFFFPGLFSWDQELAKLSKQNHDIFLMMHYCMIFVFAALAYFSLFRAREMINTRLGRALCISWGLFFLFRAVLGPVIEGLGKTEDIFLLILLIIMAALYLIPGLTGRMELSERD